MSLEKSTHLAGLFGAAASGEEASWAQLGAVIPAPTSKLASRQFATALRAMRVKKRLKQKNRGLGCNMLFNRYEEEPKRADACYLLSRRCANIQSKSSGFEYV
jgi:hypothetical protein